MYVCMTLYAWIHLYSAFLEPKKALKERCIGCRAGSFIWNIAHWVCAHSAISNNQRGYSIAWIHYPYFSLFSFLSKDSFYPQRYVTLQLCQAVLTDLVTQIQGKSLHRLDILDVNMPMIFAETLLLKLSWRRLTQKPAFSRCHTRPTAGTVPIFCDM